MDPNTTPEKQLNDIVEADARERDLPTAVFDGRLVFRQDPDSEVKLTATELEAELAAFLVERYGGRVTVNLTWASGR